MRRPIKLATGFPSAEKAAKRLGVTKEDARRLVQLSVRLREGDGFVLPLTGRLIFKKSKLPKGLAPGAAINIFTRRVALSKSIESSRRVRRPGKK